MLKFSKLAAIAAAGLMALMWVAPAQAQATRTWVSGVGDDANPCSRTAPCKTLAGAISKTATGGEIDCLDPGGVGVVTITKSITIDGLGLCSILSAGTNGINISSVAGGTKIKIRRITINGAGTGLSGIKFNSFVAGVGLVASVIIEHVGIFNMTGNGVDFQQSGGTVTLMMLDTEIQYVNIGVLLKPAGGIAMSAELDRVTSWGNALHGLDVEDGATASAVWSDFSANSGKGVFVNSASVAAIVNLDHVQLAQNLGQGMVVAGASGLARISDVGFYNNGAATGMAVAGGAHILSFQNNHNAGGGAPTNTLAPQ